MWCHYCRKANHTDAQCHCTRPADWRPKPEDAEPQPRARFVVRELYDAVVLTSRPPWPTAATRTTDHT